MQGASKRFPYQDLAENSKRKDRSERDVAGARDGKLHSAILEAAGVSSGFEARDAGRQCRPKEGIKRCWI
jgi:hypothetical protein